MTPIFYLENDENDVLLLNVALRKSGLPGSMRDFRKSAQLKSALLALLPRELPKVILVDLNLDGEYGLDTIRWLRDQPALRHIPAFVFSSGQLLDEVASVLEQNAAGYIFKPCSFDSWRDIAQQLKEMIENPAEARAAGPLEPALDAA